MGASFQPGNQGIILAVVCMAQPYLDANPGWLRQSTQHKLLCSPPCCCCLPTLLLRLTHPAAAACPPCCCGSPTLLLLVAHPAAVAFPPQQAVLGSNLLRLQLQPAKSRRWDTSDSAAIGRFEEVNVAALQRTMLEDTMHKVGAMMQFTS